MEGPAPESGRTLPGAEGPEGRGAGEFMLRKLGELFKRELGPFFRRLGWFLRPMLFHSLIPFLRKAWLYIKALTDEPLFWAIVVGLIILLIIGYVLEGKKKRNEDHSHSGPEGRVR
jgi:hypothetical protein